MCLILFAFHPNSQFKLVVAANRDEFYKRPTRTADYWPEQPDLLAGKDLEMGGTWLGVTRSGRFSAVTNFRETPSSSIPPRSRGDLTTNFLTGEMTPTEYLAEVDQRASEYKAFNLLVGDGDSLYYYCNREAVVHRLEAGVYGLSNDLLDCDWPKVSSGREQLARLLDLEYDETALFNLLAEPGNKDQQWSAKFIASPEYGTCAATVLAINNSGFVSFRERNFSAGGLPTLEQDYHFKIENPEPVP